MKNLFSIRQFAILSALFIGFAGLSSCDNDAPEPENESEVITTARLSFTSQAAGSGTVTFQAKDADGDGPGNIVIDPISLSPNTTYNVRLEFLNELESPAEDITEEVRTEGEEHQIFYGVEPTGLVNISYNDEDVNGLPIGLNTIWETAEAGSGNITLTLKHQPEIKSTSSGINDGETDISVTFAVTLE